MFLLHKMNKYINNEIYDFFEKEQSGSDRRPSFDETLNSFSFDSQMAKYYKFKDLVMNDIEYIKILLVVAMKEITWRKELENKFDIHPEKISSFFKIAKQNGIVYYRPLVEVEHILFESVIKQNSPAFYGKRDTVKVYTLSPEGKEICKKMMNEIAKLSNSRSDLQLHLSFIQDKTKLHRHMMLSIHEAEWEYLERKVTYPDGQVEARKTLRMRKMEDDSRIALIELKKQKFNEEENLNTNLSLLNKKTSDLVEIEKKNELALLHKMRNSPQTTYIGGHFPSKSEALVAMEGISKEEEKTFKKEIQRSETECHIKNKKLFEDSLEDPVTKHFMKGIINYINGPKLITKSNSTGDEGLDFLNTL
jgi:DNA-binding PadR family transcriptional regulator